MNIFDSEPCVFVNLHFLLLYICVIKQVCMCLCGVYKHVRVFLNACNLLYVYI